MILTFKKTYKAMKHNKEPRNKLHLYGSPDFNKRNKTYDVGNYQLFCWMFRCEVMN